MSTHEIAGLFAAEFGYRQRPGRHGLPDRYAPPGFRDSWLIAWPERIDFYSVEGWSLSLTVRDGRVERAGIVAGNLGERPTPQSAAALRRLDGRLDRHLSTALLRAADPLGGAVFARR